MSSNLRPTTEQLIAAQADALLVRVYRGTGDDDMDWLEGYVVAIGRRWLLLAQVSNDIWLTGWSAVCLRDVSVVEPRANARFITEALRRRAVAAAARPARCGPGLPPGAADQPGR